MTALLNDPTTGLYPEIEPFHTGMFKVSNIHEIYFEQSGNPKGKPVIFVHGGPGGGSDPKQRRFFDPLKYRIILFDQRGCGKSVPFASLEHNTTWDLVSDIEELRKHLKIEQWQVFGGSWGSTLALAYSETHPEAVTEILLRGIFLLRKKEIHWFYQSGADAIYPDAWEAYRDFIPVGERHDFLSAYYKRLTTPDKKMQIAAAQVWSVWEATTSRLYPDPAIIQKFSEEKFALAFARIESHYFMNGGFFDSDNQLIEQVARIRHIPAVIVQGRYDVVCPMMSAWDLHKAWPEAEFIIVPDAGHSVYEAGITRALVAATDRF